MTQVVRQKWVVFLASANLLLALGVVVLVALALGGVKKASAESGASRDAELRGIRAELESLRGMRDELRGFQRALPAPPDPQLAQTLQLIASEQQLLMVRSLQQATPAQPAAEAAAQPARKRAQSAARRSRKALRNGCTAR